MMSQVDVKTQMVNDYGDMTQMSSDCHKLIGTAGDWRGDTDTIGYKEMTLMTNKCEKKTNTARNWL